MFNPTECAELGLVPPRAIARRYRISVSRLLGALFNPTFPVHAGEAATIPGGWSITAQDLPEGTGARIRANRLKKRLYVGDEVIAWVRRHRPEWELNADQLLHTAVDLEARGFQGLAEYHLELGIEKQNS